MGKRAFDPLIRLWRTQGQKEFVSLILFESLILAQDERWRRG